MPTISLDAATMILQNIKNKQAVQSAKNCATPYRAHKLPLLNRRGWTPLIFKEDRQCTNERNVWRFLVNTVAEESNKYYIFWVCIFSLSYPACKEHAPCCHLSPAPL